jgi:hypothetical protein
LYKTRTKVLRVFLLAIHSHLGFCSSLPLSQTGLKLACNVNIIYVNLKSEKSQDYTQKHKRNCTFMNSTSALLLPRKSTQDETPKLFTVVIFGPFSLSLVSAEMPKLHVRHTKGRKMEREQRLRADSDSSFTPSPREDLHSLHPLLYKGIVLYQPLTNYVHRQQCT